MAGNNYIQCIYLKKYAQEVYIPAPNAIIKFNWNNLYIYEDEVWGQ